MREIIQLLKLTLEEKKRLTLAFVFSMFAAFFTYLFVNLVQPIIDKMFLQETAQASAGKPGLIGVIFDKLRADEDQLMWLIPLILVIVIFGKGLFTFLSSFFIKSVGHKVVKKLRDDLFENIVYQSTDFFDYRATGELMSRLTNDVDKIQQAVSGSMGDFIREIFILIALLVYVFITDWQLAMISFVIAPTAVIPLILFSRQLKKRGMQGQVKIAQIYNILHEAITGNKIVKAFTMEKFELKKFAQATKSYFKTSIKLAWIGSLSSPFMEFLGGVIGAVVLGIGTWRITQGYISPGDFCSFIVAIFYSYTPIKRLSKANNTIQLGLASYERIQEIFQAKPQVEEHPRAYPLPPVKGRVRFENVSFSYNEMMPVLHDVNFEVKPAETVALVGLSGAGKTTIINLLSRFYDPTSGKITIDGIDIHEVSLSSLRSQIGLVTQDLILFNDTVRNNIAYGLEEISTDRIVEAAKAAKAHEFIKKLPKGYDADIGEKGTLLSSGQRQRLTIARTLLKDPPILVLDEATSALDSESERLIQIAMANVMKDRTTFVIAHRLSTVRGANRIFVVDKGRIAEIGTHEELCQQDGIYKKLYDLQFLEEEEKTP
ncbi:MAG: ABC transporter ATP-binding protein [Candidatus Aminicenantes bacterium]|nr:ABC transporter ATP-binding protein [Candidatus Aminicenantes bacterium]MBL7082972.1 ABC transporter ATP-binding protein [Candidatus Aminicenantes bacterium]